MDVIGQTINDTDFWRQTRYDGYLKKTLKKKAQDFLKIRKRIRPTMVYIQGFWLYLTERG